MKKRVVSAILIVCIITTMFSTFTITSYAETGVTRSEWISNIVETFSMSVEDGAVLPDNYFGDIAPDMEYYYNILLAVEFGVIDLDAGEDFKPDDFATREFAAHTLNYALGFQLEKDDLYTYNEADTVTYPADIQVAVNRGWFTLSDGNFLPEQNITQEESAAMLSDAKKVLERNIVDEEYESSFEFAEGVIVFPQGTDIDISEDYTVTVTDYTTNIKANDVFVVFTETIPVALKATSVTINENVTTITSTKEGAENAIISADCEATLEIDPENFVATDVETFSVTETETDDVQLMSIDLQSIDYDKKTKTLTASKNINLGGAFAGSIIIEVKNINFTHIEKTFDGFYEACISADTTVTKCISFDFESYEGLPDVINIGYINIGGIGKISLDLDISLKGGMSSTERGTIFSGISYKRWEGFQVYKNYIKEDYSLNADADLSIGLTLSLEVDLLFINGSLWGSVGIHGSYKCKVYEDGTPLKCETINAYLYASVGAVITIDYVLDMKTYGGVNEIYTRSNSPFRVCYHYEDGELVESCTRGKKDNDTYTKYTTKKTSAYFNPPSIHSKSTYTDSSTGSTTTLWTYTLDDENNATITGYSGTATAIAIPGEIDGYKVTKIDESAFTGLPLVSVIMANSITEIKANAFYKCEKLTTVTLSKNLNYLGAKAFGLCNSLNNILIPKSLEKSGNGLATGPFYNCTSLKNVSFDEGITKIPENLFSECTGLESIIIPNTIVDIESQAFYKCEKLTTVTLSKNLNYLGAKAFGLCNSLNNLLIPKSLEKSGNGLNIGPFYKCSSLKNVCFESGIVKIPKNLFRDCTGLEKIDFPDTVVEIGQCSFSQCTNLTSVDIPDSVTTISSQAFYECSNLESAQLPKYLANLGTQCFGFCVKLNDIIIPKSLENCGDLSGPFYKCSSLKNVSFEDGREEIPQFLFSNCTGLEEIVLPDNLTTINSSVFYNCSSLKEINIPNSVNTMGTNLFCGCLSLEKVKLPDTTKIITDSMFSGCENLKEIELPDTVSEIGSHAFSDCKSLKNINLPLNLTKIGFWSFYKCISLENIQLPESLSNLGDRAFYKCSSLTEITIPQNVTYFGYEVFYDCDSLSKAEINFSGSIGFSGFYDCDSLQSISIGDKVTSIGSNLCYGCDNLTDIKLGKGIANISDSAFRLCQNLETITVPRFCTTISANAFAENTKLKSAYIPENTTSIQDNSFSYPNIMTIYGKADSYAQEYSESRGFPFVAIDAPINTLAFPESSINIARYETITPDMQIMPGFDTDIVSFTSSDENIATVSVTGAIYGKSYGSATITMASASGLSDTIEVTVVRPATSISLSKEGLDLVAGSSETLTAVVSPENSTDIIKWSSDNTDVAVVDENGMVTAIKEGNAIITAVASYGNKSATCIVTVVASDVEIIDVTDIKLNANEQEITIGTTYRLKAEVLPINATNKLIEWTSSNTSVADVTDGIITAKSLGEATITAKTVSGGFTATCIVTVVPKVEITSFTAADYGANAFINLSVVNAPEDAVVYIASYDINGKLLEVQNPILSNGNASAILSTANVHEYNAFVWKAYKLKALCLPGKCNL